MDGPFKRIEITTKISRLPTGQLIGVRRTSP